MVSTEQYQKMLVVCGAILIFLTGILASYAINSIYLDKESPLGVSFGKDNQQPSDIISQDKIEILQDKVIIHVAGASLSQYADSGSMLPTLGENANGIKIIPSSPEQINVGDIISFTSGNRMIVHRVVSKGQDSRGFYFVTKGDNNSETDGKVYWEDVKYLTIGLIY